jgi:transposase
VSHEAINVVPALDVPAGRKPDGFYQRVAEVYAELAQLSRRPAADMAEASGVSAASVHRWVAEARRRGYLPRAEPGRRG